MRRSTPWRGATDGYLTVRLSEKRTMAALGKISDSTIHVALRGCDL
jgi:hypothetical protein